MKAIEEYINSDLHTEDGEYTDKTIRDAVRFGYNLCNAEWQEKVRWIPMQEGTYPEVRDKSYRILVKSEAGFVSTEIILSDYTHYDFENLRMFYTHWREIIE